MPLKDKPLRVKYLGEYYKKNVETFRWTGIFNRYGITKEDYLNLLEIQDNKCALCEKPFNGFKRNDIHVDHCHETNKIRGLLCMPCNVALGMLGDNEEGLNKALNYIKGNS